MDKITALFEVDLTKFVPEMGTLLERLQRFAGIAILVGPLVMLVLGLWYLLLPPKEANHKAGFRTYFGMGSVEAWRFTQKIAGLSWSAMGLVLTVVMAVIRGGYKAKTAMEVATSAARCLVWQVVLILVVYVAICVVAAIFFDKNGNRRLENK